MRIEWGKLGIPFVAGLLLFIAAAKLWKTASGDLLAASLLGASLVLLGFSVYDWTHNDKE